MADGFDVVSYLMGKQAGGGGGGGDITVESKSIDANGTYTAPANKAYSPVTVNVPNSYAAGDEGKVVSNGALVAQGSDTVTQNGTVDTTLINSLTVNVSGGGGSNWTLLASQEYEVSTSSTTATNVGSLTLPDNSLGAEDLVWVHVRDKDGKRTGYWYGCDYIFFNHVRANNPSTTDSILSTAYIIFYIASSGNYANGTTSYGVYPTSITQGSNDHAVIIKSKYNNFYGTISGTYKVDVYKLTPASGMKIFD